MKPIFAILFSVFLFSGVSGSAQTNDTVTKENVVVDSVDVQPEFPGGEQARVKFLIDNIVYPKHARDANIQGKVVVRFIVEPDGSITNIEVDKSVHELLDDEVVRLMKLMPNWKPGLVNGQPVRTRFRMPVRFKLEDTDKGKKKNSRKK